MILPTNVSLWWFLWDFCAIHMNIWYKSIILILKNISGVCMDISYMCAIMFSMEFRYYSYEATKQLQPICQYRTMTLIYYVKEVTIFNFRKIYFRRKNVENLMHVIWSLEIFSRLTNCDFRIWTIFLNGLRYIMLTLPWRGWRKIQTNKQNNKKKLLLLKTRRSQD